MRSSAQSFGGIQLFLCLTLVGCVSYFESIPETTQRESEDNSSKPVQRQASEKKSSEIDAVLMPEWECEIPNAQLGNPDSCVENAEQWSQLWTRWQPGKAVPDVDFETSMVFVSVKDAGDPNSRGYTFFRCSDGTIRPEVISSCVGFDDTDRSRIQFHILERD